MDFLSAYFAPDGKSAWRWEAIVRGTVFESPSHPPLTMPPLWDCGLLPPRHISIIGELNRRTSDHKAQLPGISGILATD